MIRLTMAETNKYAPEVQELNTKEIIPKTSMTKKKMKKISCPQ